MGTRYKPCNLSRIQASCLPPPRSCPTGEPPTSRRSAMTTKPRKIATIEVLQILVCLSLASGQPGNPCGYRLLPDNQFGNSGNGIGTGASSGSAGEQATTVWATTAQLTTWRSGKRSGGRSISDWEEVGASTQVLKQDGDHCPTGGAGGIRR
jgi:hypothetical protein